MGCRGGIVIVRRLCFVVVLLCAFCLCSLLAHADAKRTPPRHAVKPTPTPTPTPPPPPSPTPVIPTPAPAYPSLPVRAVCLGGWLVTEGWILPPLFDGIPNKDLLVRERAGGGAG
jgi:hypothetical protein